MEIDQADITTVSNFSYLKEFVTSKVRALVDGLPFNTEGYKRAKAILKAKFGKPTKITNAHIQCIMSLPIIIQNNIIKIHDFYEKLVTHSQTLDTMGKLNEINGYVGMTLDKLPAIRADLVRIDDDWQEWYFGQFIEALRKWADRNLISLDDKRNNRNPPRKDRLYQTSQDIWKPKLCVYCNKEDYKSTDCKIVTKDEGRKRILSEKKLCFNCTDVKHRAADCRSKRTCQICKNKYHSSIFSQSNPMMAATEGSLIYSVVVVKVKNIHCGVLLDTNVGSSYASSVLLRKPNLRPIRRETKRIEMMMHLTTRKIDVFEIEINGVSRDFQFKAEVSKLKGKHFITS